MVGASMSAAMRSRIRAADAKRIDYQLNHLNHHWFDINYGTILSGIQWTPTETTG